MDECKGPCRKPFGVEDEDGSVHYATASSHTQGLTLIHFSVAVSTYCGTQWVKYSYVVSVTKPAEG